MANYLRIPHTALSPEALRSLIEEFITREGTEYGEHEQTLEQKRAGVQRQIERAEAVIVFDPEAESTTLVRREELPG